MLLWRNAWRIANCTPLSKRHLHVLSCLMFVVLQSATASTSLATTCLTASEARLKWPSTHLYWHQGPDSRCWDNHARGAEHYDPRPHEKVIIPAPVPENVAGPPSG